MRVLNPTRERAQKLATEVREVLEDNYWLGLVDEELVDLAREVETGSERAVWMEDVMTTPWLVGADMQDLIWSEVGDLVRELVRLDTLLERAEAWEMKVRQRTAKARRRHVCAPGPRVVLCGMMG